MVSTVHARIACICDPKLEKALPRTSPLLGDGKLAAKRSTEEVLAVALSLGPPDPAKPYASTEALEELRDERL